MFCDRHNCWAEDFLWQPSIILRTKPLKGINNVSRIPGDIVSDMVTVISMVCVLVPDCVYASEIIDGHSLFMNRSSATERDFMWVNIHHSHGLSSITIVCRPVRNFCIYRYFLDLGPCILKRHIIFSFWASYFWSPYSLENLLYNCPHRDGIVGRYPRLS